MTWNAIKYPIGIQTFSEIITEKYLYIDKTAMLYRVVRSNKYVFLSRPRRFGKSLLLSTLEAYFQGRKELFQNLAIGQLETDWNKHAVIRIDFSGENYASADRIVSSINNRLSRYEAIYGRNPEELTPPQRFRGLILRAFEQTGRGVVILIDEYDKPLLDSIHDDNLNEQHRAELQGFYSVLKESDQYIRFAMLTGVGKFGHVSIFSGLNNLTDISLDKRYNAICGISESEIRANFGPSVADFAEENDMTEDAVWQTFKTHYDGYHFAKSGEGIYNPFSVLKAFERGEIGQYWFASGTPTFLVKILRKYQYPLNELEGSKATESDLSDMTHPERDYQALFFQAGYLTIKGYDKLDDAYILGFPNEEVSSGFWKCLYKDYMVPETQNSTFSIFTFADDVRQGRVEEFMERLKSLVAILSPGVERNKEVHFQNIMQVIFRMLGILVNVEITSAMGRCDMIVQTQSYVYVMEFKINSSPAAAITQIREKGYAKPVDSDHRKVFIIGASFSTNTNQLEDYIIESV